MHNFLPCTLYSTDKDVAKKGGEKKQLNNQGLGKKTSRIPQSNATKVTTSMYTCMYHVHLAHCKFT